MARRKRGDPPKAPPKRRQNFAAAALRARLRATIKQRERGLDTGPRRA